jgi:indole-3-glycerol phosphate synthase
LFGVNTRDLRTLKVNSERLARLSKELPDHVPSVAESGINEVQDIVNARKHGYSLALIGTALMRSSTPEIFLKELLVAGRDKP